MLGTAMAVPTLTAPSHMHAGDPGIALLHEPAALLAVTTVFIAASAAGAAGALLSHLVFFYSFCSRRAIFVGKQIQSTVLAAQESLCDLTLDTVPA